MVATRICSKCGVAFPSTAGGDTCSRCSGVSPGGGGVDREGGESWTPALSDFWNTHRSTGERKQPEPPSPAELADLFPHIEIVRLVGQGGMGAVYEGRQLSLDRPVAVKILKATTDARPGFTERFAREARALARLHHPGIVTVHDFGTSGQVSFIIMELIEGANLRSLLNENGLPWDRTRAIVEQLCDALAYAHDAGIVHRDIKPENVLLDRDERVKLTDFGLARFLTPEAGSTRLTGAGDMMGTLHYMAPEQYQSPLEVDHRADIYSLGVVAYELLTGRLPVGRFSPPSEVSALPRAVNRGILKALEPQPERRHQSVRELATALAVSVPKIRRAVTRERQATELVIETPSDAALPAGTWRPPLPLALSIGSPEHRSLVDFRRGSVRSKRGLVRELALTRSQRAFLNSLLEEIRDEYLTLEAVHSRRGRLAEDSILTQIEAFPVEVAALRNRFFASVRRELARAQWKKLSEPRCDAGLFPEILPFGSHAVLVETWKDGDGYHLRVTQRDSAKGRRSDDMTFRSLPRCFRRFWSEAVT